MSLHIIVLKVNINLYLKLYKRFNVKWPASLRCWGVNMMLTLKRGEVGWEECKLIDCLTLLPGGFCFSLPRKAKHGRSGLNFRVQLI